MSTPSSPEAVAGRVSPRSEPPARGAGRRRALTAARVRVLRPIARFRRRYGVAALFLPVVLIVAADFAVRGDRLVAMPGRYIGSYVAAMIESALLWGLLLYAAARRRGAFRYVAAAILVIFAVCCMGTQVYFHTSYSTYLNLDATLFGTSVTQSVFGQLRADAANVLTKLVPPLLFAVVLVIAARRLLRPRGHKLGAGLRALVPAMIVAVFVIPCSYRKVQASTPDVIYFHAIGGVAKQVLGLAGPIAAQVRPGLRSPPPLPALSPAKTAGGLPKAPARNVVFILTESVRADVACSEHRESCPVTPETNAAVPDRMPLFQLRSNSSTTAIQLAVLWSGLQPTASREELHSAPLLFDYAHAAGIDDAYWTGHHPMFANSRLWVQDLPTSHQATATDLDSLADLDLGADDELVTQRAEKEMAELKEPFFAVVQYCNTHVPYRVDPANAPFQPAEETKDEAKNETFRNYYKDAVYLQDKSIGKLLRFIKGAPFADRTVIFYTSDHGEAFREHGQLGHTGAILDEEVHVPGWVDAPPGTLSESERSALRSKKDEPLFSTDVTPTMLDLMGILDDPKIKSYRDKMAGSSLLRPFNEDRKQMTLGLTNCSGIWGCAYKNWGVMRGFLKVEGREWYAGWHCFDVQADPEEKNDLGAGRCGDLMDFANKLYGEPPCGK